MFETEDRKTVSLGAGFCGPITPREARRQWAVSLMVVVALGIAILSALASFGIRPVVVRTDPVIAAKRLIVRPAVAESPEPGTMLHLLSPSQS